MTENSLPMLVGDQPSSPNPEQTRQPSAQGQDGSTGNQPQQVQTDPQRVAPGRRPLFRR